MWGVLAMTRGSFSGKGLDEIFLKMGGACNPKHTGVLQVRKVGGHWAFQGASPAQDVGYCYAVRRDDGRDLLVCVSSIANIHNSFEVGEVTDSVGRGSARLFMIPHGGEKYTCFAALRNQASPGTSTAPTSPGWVSDVFIQSSEVKDINHDGRPDLVVDLVDKSSPVGEYIDDAVNALSEKGEITGRHRLVFVNDGASIKADAASRQKIRSWCPEPIK